MSLLKKWKSQANSVYDFTKKNDVAEFLLTAMQDPVLETRVKDIDAVSLLYGRVLHTT